MKKNELLTAIIALILIIICVFIVGMRAELQEKQELTEQRIKSITESYEARIEELELELESERQIEHIVTTIEYVPLPVDYETSNSFDPTELTMLAQMAIGEDTQIDERPEAVAAVMETVFNRLDSEDPYFPDTVADVITQENAYIGYSAKNPVDARYYALACDVWLRHELKLIGVSDPGYVIPYDCCSFASRGDGVNHFRTADGTEVFPEYDVYEVIE